MQITKTIEIKLSFNFEKTVLISNFFEALYKVSDKKLNYENFINKTIDDISNKFIETIELIKLNELKVFFNDFNKSLETFLINGKILIENKEKFVKGIRYFIELPIEKNDKEFSLEFSDIRIFSKSIKNISQEKGFKITNNIKLKNRISEFSLVKKNKYIYNNFEIIFNPITKNFIIKNLIKVKPDDHILLSKPQNNYTKKIFNIYEDIPNKEIEIKPIINNSKIGDIKEFKIYDDKELADFKLIENLKNEGWIIISRKNEDNMIVFTVRKEY